MSTRRNAGFTLLEVMVAVAILALGLTAIFSSEAGAMKMSQRARKMGLGTLLVRCKMGEIEEQVASEGLPAIFDSGTDNCCEDSPIDGFTCAWEIDPIVLPDTMFPTGDEESDAKGAAGDKDKTKDKAAKSSSKGPNPDPMGALKEIDPAAALSGGGLGGFSSMALSYTYPVLKPGFEAQIRRATVTVRWKEGTKEHSFDVTQYIVANPPTNNATQQQQQLQQLQTLQGGQTPGTGLGQPGSFGNLGTPR